MGNHCSNNRGNAVSNPRDGNRMVGTHSLFLPILYKINNTKTSIQNTNLQHFSKITELEQSVSNKQTYITS